MGICGYVHRVPVNSNHFTSMAAGWYPVYKLKLGKYSEKKKGAIPFFFVIVSNYLPGRARNSGNALRFGSEQQENKAWVTGTATQVHIPWLW